MAARDPVNFTRSAAERIANAVRQVEMGDRDGGALQFARPEALGRRDTKTFRMCTFTGAWSKNNAKTVTFLGVTTTPNTVSATNLFAAIGTAASSRNCAIAKDGAAWYLIAAEC